MLKILEILVSNVGPGPVMYTQVSRAFPQPSSKLPKFYPRLGLGPPSLCFSIQCNIRPYTLRVTRNIIKQHVNEKRLQLRSNEHII